MHNALQQQRQGFVCCCSFVAALKAAWQLGPSLPCSTIDSTKPHSLGPAAILLHAAHKATAMQGLTQVSSARTWGRSSKGDVKHAQAALNQA